MYLFVLLLSPLLQLLRLCHLGNEQARFLILRLVDLWLYLGHHLSIQTLFSVVNCPHCQCCFLLLARFHYPLFVLWLLVCKCLFVLLLSPLLQLLRLCHLGNEQARFLILRLVDLWLYLGHHLSIQTLFSVVNCPHCQCCFLLLARFRYPLFGLLVLVCSSHSLKK